MEKEKEKEKEVVLFVVSMSQTMGIIAPAPIDMGEMDEFRMKSEGATICNFDVDHEDEKEEEEEQDDHQYKSRWAHCSDLIRTMVGQLVGCNVAVHLAKNTELGLDVTRGNSEDQLDPIFSTLDTIAATYKSGGQAESEFVFREIDSMHKSTEFEKKSVHWFIDVETFLTTEPPEIDFPMSNVTMYIVGELRTFQADLEKAKELGAEWCQRLGADLKLLASGADFDDLRKSILDEVRYEWTEQTVECFVSHETIQLKLLSKSRSPPTPWKLRAISVVGFLPEIELQRLNTLGEKCEASKSYHVSAAAGSDNEVLFTLAQYMLSQQLKSVACICACVDEEGDVFEYCVLAAHSDDEKDVGMMLVRFEALTVDLLEQSFELQPIDRLDEPHDPYPDESYLKIAPVDKKEINRRLVAIQNLGDEEKFAKYEQMRREYRPLDFDDFFMKMTERWRIENGMDALIKKKEENNNNDAGIGSLESESKIPGIG